MEKRRTRAEAGLVNYESLTDPQRGAIGQVVVLLNEMAGIAATQKPGRKEGVRNDDFLAQVDERRHNTAVLIDGRRGDGKTTAMLWVLGYLRLRHHELTHEPRNETSEALRRALGEGWENDPIFTSTQLIIPLRELDLYPLADDSNVLLLLLLRLRRAAQGYEAPPEHCGSREGSDFNKAWNAAERAAVARSPGAQRTNDIDLDAWRIGSTLEQSIDAPAKVRDFIDAVVCAVMRGLGLKVPPLFLVTVDDADMQPQLASSLLRTLRGFYHPNVAFLFTGDSRLFLTVQTARFLEWLWADSKLPGDYAYVDSAAPEETANHIATEIYERIIPPSHRRRVLPLTPKARLELEIMPSPAERRGQSRTAVTTPTRRFLKSTLSAFAFPRASDATLAQALSLANPPAPSDSPSAVPARTLLDLFVVPGRGVEPAHRLAEALPDRPRWVTDLEMALSELHDQRAPSATAREQVIRAANIIYENAVRRTVVGVADQERLLAALVDASASALPFRMWLLDTDWKTEHSLIWRERMSTGKFPRTLRAYVPLDWRATYVPSDAPDDVSSRPRLERGHRRALPAAARDALAFMVDVASELGEPIDPKPSCLRDAALVWVEHGEKVPGGVFLVAWPLPEWGSFYELDLFASLWSKAIREWPSKAGRKPLESGVLAVLYIFCVLSVGAGTSLDVVALTVETFAPTYDPSIKELQTAIKGLPPAVASRPDPIRDWLAFISFFSTPESGTSGLDRVMGPLASWLQSGKKDVRIPAIAAFDQRRRDWLRRQLHSTWANRQAPSDVTVEGLLAYFSSETRSGRARSDEAPVWSVLFSEVTLPRGDFPDNPKAPEPSFRALVATRHRQRLVDTLDKDEHRALLDGLRNHRKSAAHLHTALFAYATADDDIAEARQALTSGAVLTPVLDWVPGATELRSGPDHPTPGPMRNELTHRLLWDLETWHGTNITPASAALPEDLVGPCWPALRLHLPDSDWVAMWPTPALTALLDVEALAEAWHDIQPRALGKTPETLAQPFYARLGAILERSLHTNDGSWETTLAPHVAQRGSERTGPSYEGPRWDAYLRWRRELPVLAAPESQLSADDAADILRLYDAAPNSVWSDFSVLDTLRATRLVWATKLARGETRTLEAARQVLAALDAQHPSHPWVIRARGGTLPARPSKPPSRPIKPAADNVDPADRTTFIGHAHTFEASERDPSNEKPARRRLPKKRK